MRRRECTSSCIVQPRAVGWHRRYRAVVAEVLDPWQVCGVRPALCGMCAHCGSMLAKARRDPHEHCAATATHHPLFSQTHVSACGRHRCALWWSSGPGALASLQFAGVRRFGCKSQAWRDKLHQNVCVARTPHPALFNVAGAGGTQRWSRRSRSRRRSATRGRPPCVVQHVCALGAPLTQHIGRAPQGWRDGHDQSLWQARLQSCSVQPRICCWCGAGGPGRGPGRPGGPVA